jgi:hypothetical protein
LSKKSQKLQQRRAVQAPTPVIPISIRLLSLLGRHARAVAVALVLIASTRIIATYTVFNHTSDEPAHIACGMEWLDKGVYRWEADHPPLARVATALGPFLLGIRSQGTSRQVQYAMLHEGTAILYRDHHYDLTLALARLGVLPFFWIACWTVFWWGRRYFSAATGVLAVLLFSVLPPVLAHAGLATTDMAITAFLGLAFLTGMIWVEEPTPKHALWFGGASGLMMLSKFSCVGFFPASVGLGLVCYLAMKRPEGGEVLAAVRRRIPTLGLAVLMGCLLVWAGYRFSFGKAAFANIAVPAPELFAGIQAAVRHSAHGHPAYLLGEARLMGWWYFFEVALAVKTPIGFLILLGAGVALMIRKGGCDTAPWIALAFSMGILVVGALSHLNIGLRHVLPVYIGLALVAAMGIVRVLEIENSRRWMPLLLVLPLLWLVWSSARIHPDYLAYFNEFAGSQPENILVDSDLDWGQDMKRLARRLQEVGAREVAFVPTLVADFEKEHGFPPIRPMDVVRPSAGWNAVGIALWKKDRMGLGPTHPEITPWADLAPVQERVGKSILLWYFPPGRINPAPR